MWRATRPRWRASLRPASSPPERRSPPPPSPVAAGQRDQRGHPAPVFLVLVAVRQHQVALLDRDRDEHVRGLEGGEQQVAGGHRRRRPEGDDPADVQRVADDLVEPRRAERQVRVGLVAEVQPHLAGAEQVEVADHQARQRHEQPARAEERPDQRRPTGPGTSQMTVPIGRHCHSSRIMQRLAMSTYTLRSIGGGDDARPPPLERRAGHDAVRHGEEGRAAAR